MEYFEVYGSGCSKCGRLAEVVEAALEGHRDRFQVRKVTDFMEIAAAGVMSTPALGFRGKLLVSGRIPSLDELKAQIGPLIHG